MPTGSIPAQAGEPLTHYLRNSFQWVYPRTGGGTRHGCLSTDTARGLSPHRRGNPSTASAPADAPGSIPAQAGEPIGGDDRARDLRVYPRTGGGTPVWPVCSASRLGLSPHRRGNPGEGKIDVGDRGSIPAQAGEPAPVFPGSPHRRVYPRTGGGTLMVVLI